MSRFDASDSDKSVTGTNDLFLKTLLKNLLTCATLTFNSHNIRVSAGAKNVFKRNAL